MSKKSLIALMTAAMLPDFSHSDLGIRYAMPTQGCWTQAHRKSGVAAAKRAAKKSVVSNCLFQMVGRPGI